MDTSVKVSFKIDGLSSPVWVARFDAVEAISSLFEIELVLSSDDKDIAFSDVVGKPALLTLELEGTEPRHFHGIVARFRHAEDGRRFSIYHATVVPKLWRLRHRHDARIFQAKKVPDILSEVLKGGDVTDVRLALTGSYSPREYCVQYRESDFAFVSRLMEEEGIYYYFEHTEDKHTLVLADTSTSSPAPIAGTSTVPYRGTLGSMVGGEGVSRFSYAEEVRPGKVTLTDFNFKKPSLSLLGSSAGKLDSDLEVYDYPGEYEVPGDGSTYSKVRLEEWQARRAVADGETGCIRMTPGYLFTLSDHPRDADNRKYLITAVRHHAVQPHMAEGAGGPAPGYGNAFQAIPNTVPFRPERVTPRPTIKGVQTAIVTGPGGEEVHTDEHGRVKVHFHWDRKGTKDDKSSCWIRVSQIWAGAGWGAMWIPRVGHEVVVDFLEGDPDRPIIVGRVYHGANVPPYPLPAEKTKSTIKSDSSKGGGGNNEIRFEDKKGQEEIWIHGQKDWNIKIEHDKNQVIGHDETLEVGNDQTIRVKHDRQKRVDNDQSESIGGNKSIDVTKSHTESIGGDESLEVSGQRDVSVGKDHSESVGGSQAIDIGGDQSLSVGKGMTLSIGASKGESIHADSSETVGKNKSVTVNENFTLSVTKDGSIKIGKNLKEEVGEKKTVIVGTELSVQVGDGVITIKKNGDISVAGKKITVKGSGAIEVQGSKIQVKSDGDVNVEASGKVKLKGSNVGVN